MTDDEAAGDTGTWNAKAMAFLEEMEVEEQEKDGNKYSARNDRDSSG